jgi:tRNA 2-(methylsulfanyl)-N6-isopentenyladenosine37 hydroxylase
MSEVSQPSSNATGTQPSSILLAPTAPAWFAAATTQWQLLLVDHANCEKKAASSALSLIFTYADDMALTERLSRLAREELKHFEQVQRCMRELQVRFVRLKPARYADGLRRAVRTHEPGRLLDLLVCAALIEARSYERFLGLAPHLPAPLGAFYAGLAQSEARHQALYLRLAEQRDRESALLGCLQRFGEIEAELATAPDAQFRFHSGTPTREA